MSIMTVVLAAGASSRMGSPKALLEVDGANFVTRIATTARAAGTIGVAVVVGPPDGDKIKAKLPVGAAPVWNHDPSRGMLSSVQAAVQTLPPRALGILVWPVDQPLVTQETVRRILDAPIGKIVVPRHGGKGGHPVRIPSKYFGALAALPPEAGLHGLLDAHRADVVYLDVDDPAVVQDIDTPADHAAAKGGDKGARKPH
jgi:molybdenum cofactor cytidylyltransferase